MADVEEQSRQSVVARLTRERNAAYKGQTYMTEVATEFMRERDHLRALLWQVRYAPYDEAVDEPLVYLRVPIERRVWDAITVALKGRDGLHP